MNRNHQTLSALLAIALLFSSRGVIAQETIFDNGALLGLGSGFSSDDAGGGVFSVRVQLPQSKVASIVQWSGFYQGPTPATDDFSIEIYADNGGVPANGPALAVFDIGNSALRLPVGPVFVYTANIDFGFNAGETYWLTIHDQNESNSSFFWQGADGTGTNNAVSFNDGATWSAGGGFLFTLILMGDDPPIVFDNGAPVTSTTAFPSDDSVGQIFSVPVQTTSHTTVSTVQWVGNYGGAIPATDDFSIQIYADNNGLPDGGSPLATFNVGNNVVRAPLGASILFSAEIDFVMKSGETYWLTVHDQNNAPAAFNWAGIGGTGINNSVSFNGGSSWQQGGNFLFGLFLRGTNTVEASTNNNWNSTIDLGDSFPVSVEGFNLGATTQTDEQQLENTGSTVWWFVDFPADGIATIDTFGSSYDTQLHIYTGFENGFANLEPVVNNDDFGGVQSRVEFPVNAGQCYEVRVGGFRSSPTQIARQGCITLNVQFEESKDILLGDVNCDGAVNLLDVAPFVDIISSGGFSVKADINEDGVVNLLDVGPFVNLLSGG